MGESTHWRTQMRIHRVLDTFEGVRLEVSILGWNPHRVAVLPVEAFPDGFLGAVEHSPGPDECVQYAYAEVNLRAERASELAVKGPYELHRVRFHESDEHPLGSEVEQLGTDRWDEDGEYLYD